MESEVKDGEEESLQTAFKKLRVDADGSTAAIRASETPTQRIQSRSNSESAKPKMACTKDNWHGCSRKSSRGVVRNQRRRRSKSPILLPPKFTYCSSRMSSPACCLKHKSQCETSKTTATLGTSLPKDLLQTSHCSPVFGTTTYEPYCLDVKGATAAKENSVITSDDEQVTIKASVSGSPKAYSEKQPNSNMPSDFQTLSKLNEDQGCSCPQDECQCKSWQGVEVYSFTGLRHVISECEKNMTAEETSQMTPQRRTQSGSGTSGSPRSCSEQARAYVDDITIEDLSGYMEYYLYIPKKMSHMAEMMYT